MNRHAFLKQALVAGMAAAAALPLGVPAVAAPARRPGPRRHGVTYDVGTEFLGELNRTLWSERLLVGELRAVDEGLHCDAVTVFGTPLDRLTQAATEAVRRGLHVTVQPRLFDHPQAEILDHLARAAREAERLRRAYRPEVILAVGCEYLLFAPGIVPGDTFLDRIRFLTEEEYDLAVFLRRLDAFLAEAVAVARREFRGRLTYAAVAGVEQVDWGRFDIVGLDYYTYHADPTAHAAELRPYRRWGKPIMIHEFGSCTYEGAPERGGMGYDIVDWDGPVPTIRDGYVRSEREQADHLATMLDVFEAEGFLCASPYTFIAPDGPHSPIPRYDLDMASFSLVKTIRKDHADPASPYRWEPKLSFHAVARHHRTHRSS